MNSDHIDAYFNEISTIPRSRTYQERSVPKFLKKVFSILEENKFNEYISWSDDGSSIIVKKPTEFAQEVLPLFFRHGNFSSFIRQLNMYKFKKTKNCYYDHIFTHQMFQRGKIDLLRNIQRKATEGSATQSEAQSLKAENTADVERIIEENTQYKKIHKDLATQVEFIENKMKTFKDEVARLYEEQRKTKANEKFLKNILKSLTKSFGFDNIAKAIQNDTEDHEFLEMNVQSQVPASNSDENDFLEKNSEYEQYPSEYFSTDDTPQSFERNQICCSQDELERQPLFSLDFAFNHNLNNVDCDKADISPQLSKFNSYRIWVDELKIEDNGKDMLFGQPNNRFVGDLNIEDF